MGDYTKIQKLEMEERQLEIYKDYMDIFSKAVNILTDEGLWVMLGTDLFLVLGDIEKTESHQVESDPDLMRNWILWEQRHALVGFLNSISDLANIEDKVPIPILQDAIAGLNPIAPFYKLLRGYHKAIAFKAAGARLGGDEDTGWGNGDKFYALPPEHRIACSILIPAAARTIYNFFTGQFRQAGTSSNIPFIPMGG